MTSVGDRFPVELADLLHDDPVVSRAPASTLDVAGLIRRGDRVRRRRGLVGAGAAALAVAVVSVGTAFLPHTTPATPLVPPRPTAGATIAPTIRPSQIPVADCTIERLRTDFPTLHKFWPVAIDPTGRYIVGANFSLDGQTSTAVLLDRTTGTVTEMPPQIGAEKRVGADGMVIGDDADQFGPLVYHDGKLIHLAVPHGKAARSMGVNAHNAVVGYVQSYDKDGALTGPTIAVEWPADHPDQVRVLSAVPGSVALTITDDGWVGGTVGGKPYVWSPDGTGRSLSVTWPDVNQSVVFQIVGTLAIGVVMEVSGRVISTVWDLTTGAPTYYEYPDVGFDQLSTGGLMRGTNEASVLQRPTRAFTVLMTLDGKVTRLPTPAGTKAAAIDMTADGRTFLGSDFNEDPLIWHC